METKFQERLGVLLDENTGLAVRIAEALNISTAAVSAWRRRGTNPKVVYLREVAKIGGVSLDWLVGLSEDRGGGSGSPENVLEIVDHTLWLVQSQLMNALQEDEELSPAGKRRLMMRFNSFDFSRLRRSFEQGQSS